VLTLGLLGLPEGRTAVTLRRPQLPRVAASAAWPSAREQPRRGRCQHLVRGKRAAGAAAVAHGCGITEASLENGPRDRKVRLRKWLKGDGEVSDVSASEKKGKACSTW